MLSNFQKLITLPVALFTIWALLFGFFCMGMFHKSAMPVKEMVSALGLVEMVSEEHCCGTTMSQHIESWRDTFLAVPKEIRDNLALLLLGLALAFVFVRLPFRRDVAVHQILHYRLYTRDNPDLALFNHLKLAFAQGILNPKIY